jgi:hypothetical protein
MPDNNLTAYNAVLRHVLGMFRFYPFLMLGLQLFLILTQREFGPMLAYERKQVPLAFFALP